MDVLGILLNFGFQIKDSDFKLALESGDSQIWWVLKNKRDEGMTEIQKKNCQFDEEFSEIREENETFKKTIQEYEVFIFILDSLNELKKFFSLFNRQLGDLEQENLRLKLKVNELQEENEILKSELSNLKKSRQISNDTKEKLELIPKEIATFISENELEKDLDGLLVDSKDLKIKKQVGSGGFATVYRFFKIYFLINYHDFMNQF